MPRRYWRVPRLFKPTRPLTLAGSVIVSGIVAFTLSPVMASLLLNSRHAGRIERFAEWLFSTLAKRYGGVLGFSLRQRWISGGFALLVCVSLPFLYLAPKRELAPTEDQAAVLMAFKSPQHVSLDYAARVGEKWNDLMMRVPEGLEGLLAHGLLTAPLHPRRVLAG